MAELNDVIEAPLVVQEDESLSKVIGLMKENYAYGVIVASGNAFVGVVDDRCLLKFDGDAESAKCGNLATKTPVLNEKSTPEEVIAGFINSQATVLPVLKGEKIVGSVTRRNALKLLAGSPAIASKKVSDVMTSPAVTFPEDGNLSQAVSKMRGNRVYRLVVVDSRGKLAGVLSSYDLAVKAKAYSKKSFRDTTFRPYNPEDVKEERVSNLMTTSVITIGAEAPLREAVDKMLKNSVRALVVAKEDKPVGVVSARNVFEACLVGRPLNVFIHGLSDEDKVLKESIVEYASVFLERLKKFVRTAPDDYLELHLKSNREGVKKRFEVKAKIIVQGKVYTVSEPNIEEHRMNWDAHLAVKEALDELEKVVVKSEKRKPVREKFEQHRVRYGG